MNTFLEQVNAILTHPIMADYVLPIAAAFLIAWIIHRLSYQIAVRLVSLGSYAWYDRRPSPERLETLYGLMASAITIIAIFIAFLTTIGRFVDDTTLVWMVGLSSAGIGLGIRPLISDYLTGVNFIFEDSFYVGDKIEILNVEGIIEKVNLRTVHVRSPSGELYIIPNGEIRVVRNFTRGKFSTADITLTIAAKDLNQALPILQDLGHEAVEILPNLLEPWEVISASGTMDNKTQLTLLTKARFGMAAEMRPRLLALVHERLQEAEIELGA